jgi:hypothetical protein
MRWCRFLFLLLAGLMLLTGTRLVGGESPTQLRIIGPDVLQRATRNLIYVEGLYGAKNWKPIAPDQLTVKATGAGQIADDPAGKAMNPFEVLCEDVAKGKLFIEVRAGDRTAARTFEVGARKPAGPFEGTIDTGVVSHRFTGMGGGVLFYDNQFDISATDDIYDWCFRDVNTSFLHVLIRSDYEAKKRQRRLALSRPFEIRLHLPQPPLADHQESAGAQPRAEDLRQPVFAARLDEDE